MYMYMYMYMYVLWTLNLRGPSGVVSRDSVYTRQEWVPLSVDHKQQLSVLMHHTKNDCRLKPWHQVLTANCLPGPRTPHTCIYIYCTDIYSTCMYMYIHSVSIYTYTNCLG